MSSRSLKHVTGPNCGIWIPAKTESKIRSNVPVKNVAVVQISFEPGFRNPILGKEMFRLVLLLLTAVLINPGIAFATNQFNKENGCEVLPGPIEPMFRRAYLSNDGELTFYPLFETDWKVKAPDHVAQMETSNLSPEELSLLRDNLAYTDHDRKSELIFEHPLDCATFIGTYYLISESGISAARLLHYEVSARFETPRQERIPL